MMRFWSLFYILFSLLTTSLNAQMTPEQVVQKQLETYNSRDIDGFMALITDDITFYDFSDGRITMKGYDACRAFYSKLFRASPKLHSTILTRMVFGNRVIDHESITGRNGNDEVLELVLIYEVKDEKISKVTVLKNTG